MNPSGRQCLALLLPLLLTSMLPATRAQSCLACMIGEPATLQCCALFSCPDPADSSLCSVCQPEVVCQSTPHGPCEEVVAYGTTLVENEQCVECNVEPKPDNSSCDDQDNKCTTGDTCQGGICGALTVCDDGNECTTEQCLSSTGNCTSANVADEAPCSSVPSTNPCRVSQCMAGSCVANAGLAPVGTSCDDGDVCTAGDECTAAGDCVGTAIDNCGGGLFGTASLSATQQALLIAGAASLVAMGMASVVYLRSQRAEPDVSASSGNKATPAPHSGGSKQRKKRQSRASRDRRGKSEKQAETHPQHRDEYIKSFQLP